MKLLVTIAILMSMTCFAVSAKEMTFDHYINKPYSEVRTALISQGWQAVNNKKIEDASLYANGIFERGYTEVLDCISMERDQCQFVLTKNKQFIVITTKEKNLNVESIKRHQ
jgi:hypothetical protein